MAARRHETADRSRRPGAGKDGGEGKPSRGDAPSGALHARYTELRRKYAQLVARLEKRATRDLAVHRLGAFGLRSTGAGLALIRRGQIQVSNTRFVQLEHSLRGPLLGVAPSELLQQPDLRTLVLAFAETMLLRRIPALEVSYRDRRSGRLIAVRLERSVAGEEPAVLTSVEDVSERERREMELARTRGTLLHRERLRVMGELAASIAHDLGNTLRGASFQLASIRAGTPSPQRWQKAARAVSRRIEVASAVISRLHDFAQTGKMPATLARLDRIVAQAAALVETDFRSGEAPVRVHVSLPQVPPIRASSAELSLLFVNLLRNARDAMPRGGTVTVDARLVKRHVVIRVSDEGTGLSPEAKERLFEPFFTTKGLNGTGLGLWLAQGTMRRLGGEIRVANRRRGGAVFVLTFPTPGGGKAVPRRSARSEAETAV